MIRTDTDNGVTSIVLDRASKRNALTPEMLGLLEDAIGSVPDSSRVVTVRGEGKAFCSGFDLKLCASDPEGGTMRALLGGLSRSVEALRALAPPVVMGVHGAAVAGGCALLGGADVVVAERGAKLGYPVVKIGVSPAVSAPFLMSSVCSGAARSMMLDPGLVSAEDAARSGLVHELVDGDEAMVARVDEIAARIAAKPVHGVRATKALCNELAHATSSQGERALGVSLGLTGSDEEREMLGAIWS